MIIDCDTCVVRHQACADCVVGVLLGVPGVPGRADDGGAGGIGAQPVEPAAPGAPLPVEFGPVERRALEVLADHGLIPRLRLVTATPEAPERAAPGRTSGGMRRRRDAG